MIDPTKYQAHHNGPLKSEVADFLHQIRTKRNWTYAMIGQRLNTSGANAHRILNKSGNITTSSPMPQIAEGIARLEEGEFDLPQAEATGLLNHTFHLRDTLQITFALPADLSEREAERLSLFVRSLAQ